MRFETRLRTAVDRLEPCDSNSEFMVTIYECIEETDGSEEAVVGRIYGYLIPSYDYEGSLFERMDSQSASLEETYAELFDPKQGDLRDEVTQQLGADASFWDQLVVLSRVSIHPSVGEAAKLALYRFVRVFSGSSIAVVWGNNCTLMDHELSDLGFKPLETSKDMWAMTTAYESAFSQRDPDTIESDDVDESVQAWVDERWPWEPGEWPHMS